MTPQNYAIPQAIKNAVIPKKLIAPVPVARLDTAAWGSGVGDPTWNLDSGPVGERIWTHHYNFSSAFANPPIVVLSLGMLNTIQGTDVRLAFYPENVTVNGFDAYVKTWWDTLLYYVSGVWTAYGS
jgi:hypothetical protein